MKKCCRFFALILTLCTILSLFGACGKDKETTSDAGQNGLSTADINFIDSDGEATYRIIRPEEATDIESSSAILVFKKYKDTHSVSPKNQTDDEEPNVPEILIGNTNREETAIAKEFLDSAATGRFNEYIICSVNDDIVIYGRNDDSLTNAVNYFIDNYLKNATVVGGINYVYQNAEGFDVINIFGSDNLSNITIVRPIYNVSYLTQVETDKLSKDLSTTTGFDIEIVNDQYATVTGNSLSGESQLIATEDKDYEIIIGNCVRNGVNKSLDKDEYEIRIEDKNIYLNGGSPKATAMAVSEFSGMLKSKNAITSADSVQGGNYNDVINKYDSASYYRLTWSDDFDDIGDNKINENLWDVRWEEAAYQAPPGEKSTYRGSRELNNNYVKEGTLYIVAMETDKARYGGMLTTQGMMEYHYGYIEISTLHPRCEGIWTALYTMSAVSPSDNNNVWSWLYPNRDSRVYYSETDVEECYGAGNWVYQNTFAWPTEYGKGVLALPPDKTGSIVIINETISDDRGFWMDFHTYGYEWLDNKTITWTVDGNVSYVQTLNEGAEQQAYSQPVFLRLGMAAGTENHAISTNPDDWKNYNKYLVDYVHIYQHKGNALYTKKLSGNKWNTSVVE